VYCAIAYLSQNKTPADVGNIKPDNNIEHGILKYLNAIVLIQAISPNKDGFDPSY